MNRLVLAVGLAGCSNKESAPAPAPPPAPAPLAATADAPAVAVVADAAPVDALVVDAAAPKSTDELAEEIIAAGGGELAAFADVRSGSDATNEIAGVIKANSSTIKACYANALKKSPHLAGKVIVNFTIGRDGSVPSAHINKASTLTDRAVTTCIGNAIQKLRFAPRDIVSKVTFPFVFAQGG